MYESKNTEKSKLVPVSSFYYFILFKVKKIVVRRSEGKPVLQNAPGRTSNPVTFMARNL